MTTPETSTIDTPAIAPPIAPTPTPAAPARRVDPTAVASRTAIISLRTRKPSARRRAKDGAVSVVAQAADEESPDQDSTTVSLELLRAPEYKEIVIHDRGTREVLKISSLPAGRRLASGCYLVPVSSIERIYATLDARKRDRQVLVETFAARYEAIVTDAQQRLKVAFEPKMFPGVTASTDGALTIDANPIRAAFDLEYELEVADREAGIRAARGLSEAFVRREMERARDSGAALVAEIQDGLRVAFAQLVDKARDMLTPGADGERRVFRGENLERIQAFLATFGERNVAGDSDLGAVVAQAREILRGVSPDELRDAKDRSARDRLGEALGAVQSALEPLVATVPERRRRIRVAD